MSKRGNATQMIERMASSKTDIITLRVPVGYKERLDELARKSGKDRNRWVLDALEKRVGIPAKPGKGEDV